MAPLAVARGDLVIYLDSDTRHFSAHFLTGMLGPLLCHPEVRFVKGSFRRPYSDGADERPRDGGRVTELMARPLLSAFYPELGAFAQPLAGEVAARRELLERLPFVTGYAVETAMLLDVREARGAPTAWPRSTSTCATTAISRFPSLDRWPTPSCGWCSSACGRRADCVMTTPPRSRRPTAT